MRKSLESKTTKKQAFLEKLKGMDEENQKLQSQILRAISTAKISLASGADQSRNVVVDVIKMMRKMNQKTIMEKRKNKRIYNSIKNAVSTLKQPHQINHDTAAEKYEEALKSEGKKYEDVVRDKQEMIEVLKNELFSVNQKVRNLEHIIEENQLMEQEEIRRRRHTYVVQTENMTEKLQKLLKKREDEMEKLKAVLESRIKELQEEKKFAVEMETQNQKFRIEIIKLTSAQNQRQNQIKNQKIKMLEHIQNLMKERKEFQDEQTKAAKISAQKEKNLKELEAKFNDSQTKLGQHENEVKEMNQLNEELKGQLKLISDKFLLDIEKMTQQLNLTKLKMKQEENKIGGLTEQIESMRQEQNRQKQRVGQLEQGKEKSSQDLREQCQTIQLQNKKIDELLSKISEVEVEVEEKEKVIAKMRESSAQNQSEKDIVINQLRGSSEKNENDLKEALRNGQLLRIELANVNEKLANLMEDSKKQLELLTEQIQKKDIQIGNLREQIQKLELQLTGVRQNNQNLKSELSSANERIIKKQEQWSDQLKVWETRKIEWEQMLAGMETEKNGSTTKWVELSQQINALRKQQAELKGKVTKYQEEISVSIKEKSIYEEQKISLGKQIGSLKTEIEQMQMEMNKRMVKIDQLTGQLAQSQKQRYKSMSELQKTVNQLAESRVLVEGIKQSIEKQKETSREIKVLLENKEIEIRSLRDEISQIQSLSASLQKANEDKDAEKQEILLSLNKLQNTAVQLRKQLQLRNLKICEVENSLIQAVKANTQMDQSRSQLQQQLQLIRDQMKQKDEQKQGICTQNDCLKIQLMKSEDDLNKTKQQLLNLQKRLQDQIEILALKEQAIEEMKILGSKGSQNEIALIKSYTELKQSLEKSQSELKIISQEKAELLSNLDQSQKSLMNSLELSQKYSKLEEKLIVLENLVVTKQRQILEQASAAKSEQEKMYQLEQLLYETHMKLNEVTARHEQMIARDSSKRIYENQFSQLRQEFQKIKSDLNGIISSNSVEKIEQSSMQSQQSSMDVKADMLQMELQLQKEKYVKLQKFYQGLLKEYQKKQERREFGTQTEGVAKNPMHVPSQQQLQQNRIRNNSSSVSEASLRMALGDEPFFRAVRNNEVRLDLSLPPDEEEFLKGLNRNSTITSPVASFFNLNAFLTQYQNHNKIQNFNYSNSIIYKINSSKYITNPESKVAFIFQYACFLELYFSKQFLSSIRSELVMGEELVAKNIKYQDLNLQLVEINSGQQETSFSNHSQSSSKLSSSNKFYVTNQFSMNTLSKIQENKKKSKMNYSFNVFSENVKTTKLNKNEKMKVKVERIEQELLQIKMFLTEGSVQAENLRKYPQVLRKIEELKNNQIAQVLIKLIKENEGLQKCLDQMMENEQMMANTNNESYFEEKQSEPEVETIKSKRQSSLGMDLLKFITSDKGEQKEKQVVRQKEKEIEQQSSKDTYKSSQNESDLEKRRDPKAADKENCAIM